MSNQAISIVCLLVLSACSSVQGAAPGKIGIPGIGQSTTVIVGCLNQEKSAADFDQAGAEVFPVPDGVVVTHNVIHACCLSGAVSSSIEGNLVTISERLTGEPCKCECPSTLRTAVGLAPGPWVIQLRLEKPNAPAQIVQEWDVTVAAPQP